MDVLTAAILGALLAVALSLCLAVYAAADRFLCVAPCLSAAAAIGNSEDLIRMGFSEKRLNEDLSVGGFDCIVIGSGIGGLTTATLLSRRGKRVLLLEQHDVIGGCTHTFIEKGYEFDTGIHYIGGEVGDPRSALGFIFNMLTLGRLKWTKVVGDFDVAKISKILSEQHLNTSGVLSQSSDKGAPDLVLRINSAASLHNQLLERYPEEGAALESFFRLCRWGEIVFPLFAVFVSMAWWIQVCCGLIIEPILKVYFGTSSYSILRGLTRNEDLIGALTWCYGNTGLTPKDSAFIMSAIMVSHYDKGAFYPTGGTVEIAKSMVPVIAASGGRAYVRAPVSSILLDETGTVAKGVVVRGKTILAPCIVSAAGVLCTYTRLIPEGRTCPHADFVRSLVTPLHPHDRRAEDSGRIGPSCSMFSVFVGIRGNAKDLNLPAYNTWLFPSWRHDEAKQHYLNSLQKDSSSPVLPVVFVSFSSAKDGAWVRRYPDKSVVELLTIADFNQFASYDKRDGNLSKPGARGSKYNDAKDKLVGKALDVFKEEFPHLADRIDLVLGASPLTNNFYLGSTSGEIYGLEQSVTRFTTGRAILQPRQPIRGLYLSGQDALVNGLAGAMFGGISCAIAVDWTVLVDLIASFIAGI